MAIKSNSSTEEVQGNGIQLYSGLSNFKVIAVNPTMAELHTLSIPVKTEPNYEVSFSDQEYKKIVFWVKNDDTTIKVEVLMQPIERKSHTGKLQWINGQGQTTWSAEAPSYDWWSKENQRPAFVGEETLINFTKAWANVANGDEVSFDTMKKISNGNVEEIKALVHALSDNEVRLLVGVKDSKYQTTYVKYFGRVKPQRDDLFIKALNGDYGSFNADFNVDLKWGTHVATATLVSPDTIAEEEDWTMPDTPQNGVKQTEEAPF